MWTSPLLTYIVLGRSDMPLSSFAAYSLAPKSSDMSDVVRSPGADRITSSRVGNDLAFPRQRSKSPREQRFAAVVSDGDHLLQPEPLVFAARVEQMHWDHHSVFQHPIDVRLAVSRALLDVHAGQAEAVEEDDG